MTALLKRRPDRVGRQEGFDWFDQLFDDWTSMLPARRMMFDEPFFTDDMVHVDVFRDGETMVVRAELPGIDPERDLEISVVEGMLRIKAEHREEERSEDTTWMRREIRTGTLTRVLPMPEGATASDVAATYKDGMLEVRVAIPAVKPAATIPVIKS